MGGMNGSTVNFAFDRYDVDATARNILQAQANWMKSNNKSVVVEGHCDERGTREYNIALGDRRANAVKNYLVAMGVSASRIRTVSYGKERPIGTNNDQNRRGYTRVN
jgi:peptidoglycan-associated lipoprotein